MRKETIADLKFLNGQGLRGNIFEESYSQQKI